MGRVTAVVFEGGQPESSVQQEMTRVRHGVALDTLAKLLKASDVHQVILCTNYPDLADDAGALGVVVDFRGGDGFHFGERLREIIHVYDVDKLIYMGGAAAPLMQPGQLAEIAALTLASDAIVLVNNPQSPDIVAFSPAQAIDRIELPDSDNVLGHLLKESGLPRILMRNTASISFDIDTPADLIVLSSLRGVGARTRKALDSLCLDTSRLEAVRQLFAKVGSEMALIGRVSPSVALFINANFALRLRVFSEERGMRALGRVGRGEVRSLIAQFISDYGPERFFMSLSDVAEAAFFDTRVWMAHEKLELSEADRFYSDLGETDKIQNPRLRELTLAAKAAAIPVILGGHSLVAGGLWALAEDIIVEAGREPVRPF